MNELSANGAPQEPRHPHGSDTEPEPNINYPPVDLGEDCIPHDAFAGPPTSKRGKPTVRGGSGGGLTMVDSALLNGMGIDGGGRKRSDGEFFRDHIIGRNPFFILSACSMMLGCALLNAALDRSASNLSTLIVLLTAFHIYEFALLGLSGLLIRRRRTKREGRQLLWLSTPFFVDGMFLHVELLVRETHIAIAAWTVTMLLASLKLRLITRITRIYEARSHQIILLITYGMMMGLPIVANTMVGYQKPSIWSIYGTFWIAGLLVAAHTTCARRPRWQSVKTLPVWPAYGIWLVILVHASFTAHLLELTWLFDHPFSLSYASPVLLALGLLAIHRAGKPEGKIAWGWLTSSTVLAVLTSAHQSPQLFHQLFGTVGLTISPLRITLLVAFLMYGYAFWVDRRLWAVFALTACATTAFLGHTATAIRIQIVEYMWKLVPRTIGQLGAIFVIMAFALLSAGAWLSLKSSRRKQIGKH